MSNPLSEAQCSFNQVYLMIPSTKSSEYLHQMASGENRVGSKWREREREEQICGVRDGALEIFRNGVDWKQSLGKRIPENFKQIR